MTFDANGKPTINAPTAAGPFAVSPVTRIFTIDPANRDVLRPQPARHRDQRRRHARLRRLSDDARRHRGGPRRQQRHPARPLRRSADARPLDLEQSCAARSTSSPRGRSGPTAAGAAARPATPTAAPTTSPGRSRPARARRSRSTAPSTSSTPATSARSTGARCATRTRTSSSTPAASSAAAASSPSTRDLNARRHPAGFRPERAQLRAGQLEPLDAAGGPHRTTSATHPQRDRAAGQQRQSRRAAATSFGNAAPGGANCVACHSGGKWTVSRDHLRSRRREPGSRHRHRHRQHARCRFGAS
mgnify:CR=1 FL=1